MITIVSVLRTNARVIVSTFVVVAAEDKEESSSEGNFACLDEAKAPRRYMKLSDERRSVLEAVAFSDVSGSV
jgi:hypothetical protein